MKPTDEWKAAWDRMVDFVLFVKKYYPDDHKRTQALTGFYMLRLAEAAENNTLGQETLNSQTEE